jgi:hypothetical protein
MREDRSDHDGHIGFGDVSVDAHLNRGVVINPPVSSLNRSAPIVPRVVKGFRQPRLMI